MRGKDLDNLVAPGLGTASRRIGFWIRHSSATDFPFPAGKSNNGLLRAGGPAVPVDSPGNPAAVSPAFQSFTDPTGAFMYIATQAGQTGEFHTTFVGPPAAGYDLEQLGPVGRTSVVLPVGGWPRFTGMVLCFL